jgi:putative protein-disulfide isomerase
MLGKRRATAFGRWNDAVGDGTSAGEERSVSGAEAPGEPATGGGEAPTAGKRIVYVADPMCSWCWGFEPVIAAIEEGFGAAAPLRLVVGGLRPGTTAAMDAKSKAYVRHHWEQVHETTGQPFGFDFFARDGFVYDTEPACRAVVAVRNLAPAATLGYFQAVQRAFYADGRDVTRTDTLTEIAGESGVEAAPFEAVFAAPEIAEATRADFRLAQALGITGFPAVVLKDDAGYAFLTIGYQPFKALKPYLELWMRA